MGALIGNTLKERRERREARLAAAARVQCVVPVAVCGPAAVWVRVGSGVKGSAALVSTVVRAGEEGEFGAVVPFRRQRGCERASNMARGVAKSVPSSSLSQAR